MRQKAFLGLDLGGTGAKAGVFDLAGRLYGSGYRRLCVQLSSQGHAEISIDAIYAAARGAVRQALEGQHPPVLAMSIVSQGQTFVALDSRGRALHPAILWYDSRATNQAAQLRRRLAGHKQYGAIPVIDDICSVGKILWLKERDARLAQNAAMFYLLPEYMTWRLTGQAVTDFSTASSTGLCEDGATQWHDGALKAAGLTNEQFATIRKTGTPIATLQAGVAAEWGLPSDTLVVTGTNDQYAGAIGAGNCHSGIVTEMSGTCLAMVTLVKALPRKLPPGLIVGRFPIEPYRFVLAYAKTAGLTLDWFRREFAAGDSFHDLEIAASEVPIGCDGLTAIPHFDGRISPMPDAGLRGLFSGVTLRHGRNAFYRALLESLAFVMRENLLAMKRGGMRPQIIRAIGGGAVSDLWLQIKADVIGLPVERPVVTESPVLGAAVIAATGYGAFRSIMAGAEQVYRPDRTFCPVATRHREYETAYHRFIAAQTRISATQ